MRLYQDNATELSETGKRFMLTSLAELYGCDPTFEAVAAAMGFEADIDITRVDDFGIRLTVVTAMDHYSEYVRLNDLDNSDYSKVLLQRRFVDVVTMLTQLSFRDLAMLDAADEEYGDYDDDYDYDDYDTLYGDVW